MVHSAPEFETRNAGGSTSVFSGDTGSPVGTLTNIPAVADKYIEKFELLNAEDGGNDIIQVSMDGGSTFYDIEGGNSLEWNPKGLKQLVVKGTKTNLAYKAIINFEDFG